MALPITASAISVVAPKLGSLQLFSIIPSGLIVQSVYLDGVWSHDVPSFGGVPFSPLASITWDDWDGVQHVSICPPLSTTWSDGCLGRFVYTTSTPNTSFKNTATPKARVGIQERLEIFGLKRTPSLVLARLYMTLATRSLVFAFTIRVSAVCPHFAVYSLKWLEEDGSRIIRELCNDDGWHNGDLRIEDAVEGTGIGAVTYTGDDLVQIRVYYQTVEDLCIKEYCHNNKGWFLGEFIRPVHAIRPTDLFFFLQRRFQPWKSTI